MYGVQVLLSYFGATEQLNQPLQLRGHLRSSMGIYGFIKINWKPTSKKTSSIFGILIFLISLTITSYSSAKPVYSVPRSVELGIAAATKGDYNDALRLITPEAEAGDPMAQNALAYI